MAQTTVVVRRTRPKKISFWQKAGPSIVSVIMLTVPTWVGIRVISWLAGPRASTLVVDLLVVGWFLLLVIALRVGMKRYSRHLVRVFWVSLGLSAMLALVTWITLTALGTYALEQQSLRWKKAGLPSSMDDVMTFPVEMDRNAALGLMQAMDAVGPVPEWLEMQGKSRPDLATLEVWLASQTEPLQMVEEALLKPEAQWPEYQGPEENGLPRWQNGCVKLGHLLAARARLRYTRGQLYQAGEDWLRIMTLADRIPSDALNRIMTRAELDEMVVDAIESMLGQRFTPTVAVPLIGALESRNYVGDSRRAMALDAMRWRRLMIDHALRDRQARQSTFMGLLGLELAGYEATVFELTVACEKSNRDTLQLLQETQSPWWVSVSGRVVEQVRATLPRLVSMQTRVNLAVVAMRLREYSDANQFRRPQSLRGMGDVPRDPWNREHFDYVQNEQSFTLTSRLPLAEISQPSTTASAGSQESSASGDVISWTWPWGQALVDEPENPATTSWPPRISKP